MYSIHFIPWILQLHSAITFFRENFNFYKHPQPMNRQYRIFFKYRYFVSYVWVIEVQTHAYLCASDPLSNAIKGNRIDCCRSVSRYVLLQVWTYVLRFDTRAFSNIGHKLMQLIVGNVTWRSCSSTILYGPSYHPLHDLFDIDCLDVKPQAQ